MAKDCLCGWHRRGAPAYAKDVAFFDPDCKKCLEKLAQGKTTRDALTPAKLNRLLVTALRGVRDSQMVKSRRENILRARMRAQEGDFGRD